jgi:hypothetical protein
MLNPETTITEILAQFLRFQIKPDEQEADTGEERIRDVADPHTLGIGVLGVNGEEQRHDAQRHQGRS